jgi:hypothetical protein
MSHLVRPLWIRRLILGLVLLVAGASGAGAADNVTGNMILFNDNGGWCIECMRRVNVSGGALVHVFVDDLVSASGGRRERGTTARDTRGWACPRGRRLGSACSADRPGWNE